MIPLSEMTKDDLIEELLEGRARKAFKCKHGHDGHSHKNCYNMNRGVKHRVGFFDIESSDLIADWGFAYCYCLLSLNKDKMIKRRITGTEVLNYKARDKSLIKQFIKDVKSFEALVVYYGKDTGGKYQRHDIPFMRTRAEFWNIKNFPKEKELIIIDLYDVVKAKFKLKRNSLDHFCKFKKIPCKQTPLDWEVWQRARDGHEPSLKYVLKHCTEDVVATKKAFKVAYPYKRVRAFI